MVWLGTFGVRVNAQRFVLKGDATDAEAFLAANVANADGGSPLLPALASALSQPLLPGANAQLLLISDGRLADYQEAVEALQVAGIRAHTLGVGYSVDQTTLRRLAEATDGVAEVLFPGDAQLQVVVQRTAMRMMRLPLQPAARADWASPDASMPSIAAHTTLMSPASWPGALDGTPVQLFSILGRASASVNTAEPSLLDEVCRSDIVISGGAASRAYRTADYVSVRAAPARIGRMLHQCAARRGIEGLERLEAKLQHDLTVARAANSELVVKAVQSKLAATTQQIIALGVQYSLASTHTSFLIVVKDTSSPTSAPAVGALTFAPAAVGAPSQPVTSGLAKDKSREVGTTMAMPAPGARSFAMTGGGSMYKSSSSSADGPLKGSILTVLSIALLVAMLR